MGVREYRDSKGLTREELLRLTEDISLSTLQRVEKDQMKCNIKTAKQIADALEATIDEVFFGEAPKEQLPSEMIKKNLER